MYGLIWRDKIDAYRYWWRLLGKLPVYAVDKGKFEKHIAMVPLKVGVNLQGEDC